jgi:hypothetical protein
MHDELANRLQEVRLRIARLQGQRDSEAQQLKALTSEISLAKGRLSLAEEVSRIFDALQRRAHERSVGAFEKLLSAILNDVMPGEGQVRLLTQLRANDTWLDIALEKPEGLEDLLEGNGGAVTNVVSTGLRFAALSRTQNRRVVVLDEADCWLKPDRVPAFVSVIAEVSKQARTQTFFITHHDPAFFEGKVNLVKFVAGKDGTVEAVPLQPTIAQWEDNDTPGIRAIELVNVRRHVKTFVPCFPGATAFIGNNNLGKSTAIVASLKAVAYGESDDSLIRHGQTEARIVIHLEKGYRVEWSRSTKRNPTVLYRLFQGETLLHEGRPKSRGQAPDWVTDVLGISRIDDLDVQVGHQKSPVFLLNDSAPRRAQILSIGRESGYLKALMRKYEEQRSQDRETVKRGEAAVTRLTFRQGFFGKLEGVNASVQTLQTQAKEVLSWVQEQDALCKLIAHLEKARQSVACATDEVAALAQLPEVPELQDTGAIVLAAQKIKQHSWVKACADLPQLPAVPELEDLTALLALGKRIATHRKLAALENLPEVPAVPSLEAVDALGSLLTKLERSTKAVRESAEELGKFQMELEQATFALDTLKQELGECPLCGHSFEEQHEHF